MRDGIAAMISIRGFHPPASPSAMEPAPAAEYTPLHPVISAVRSSPRDGRFRAARDLVARGYRRLLDYLSLAKPRVVTLVLLTTWVGYYLARPGFSDAGRLLHTLVGTALAAAGTMALNQWMERDLDARMQRTRRRPLPEARLYALEALLVGLVWLGGGVLWLAATVNGLAAAVTVVIGTSYLLVYTPMKRRTPLCSLVGGIPGALPPVLGWGAATGALGPEPWMLFAIVFLWQVPHTLAIGALYRDDYARAGIQVLPVVDPSGSRTGRYALLNSIALFPVALLPALIGLAGLRYAAAAIVLGAAFVCVAAGLQRHASRTSARRLLVASLLYLPLLLTAMALDPTARLP